METDAGVDVQVGALQNSSWSRLVDLVRAGDPAGLEQLYAVLGRGVRFFLWRQIGTQDLDDRVHDIFVILTQSIQRGELREPERLMGYVRTIMRRQVAAHIETAVKTRRSIRPLELLSAVADRGPDPERAVIAHQGREAAMRVLKGLPERDREVLVRFYLREQTAGEICGDMGLTETQFRLIKSRAKARYGKLGQRGLALRSPANRR